MRRTPRVPFIIILLLAAAAAWAGDPPSLFYGVISDTQRPARDPLPEMKWAVGQLNEVHPDFVLWTGDLTNRGTKAQYQSVMRVAKRLAAPVYCLPGNHDFAPDEPGFRAWFTQFTGQPPWQDVRVGGWHLILLDSVPFVNWKFQQDGVIAGQEMNWLKADLAGLKPDEPIILSEHHPFLTRGEELTNPQPVLALFADRDLLYTVAGHMHCNRHAQDANGVHHFVTGALSYSAHPKECGIGYRLYSTVGRDLWTAWIETTEAVPFSKWFEAAGPGALKEAYRISLPRPAGDGGQVAVRVRYSGDGLLLKWGEQIAQTLPAVAQTATAVVVLTPEVSRPILAGPSEALTIRPVGQANVERVEVYRTGAKWEHYTLKAGK